MKIFLFDKVRSALNKLKLAMYSIYNSLPLVVRKVIDVVVVVPYVLYLRSINSVRKFLTKKRPNLKSFLQIHLKVYLFSFVVFSFLGLSFYLDGIHGASSWLSLTTLYRLDFVFLSLLLTSFIFYGKNNFSFEEKKKGGKNGSYYKK
ncbi:hypothetical protein ACQ9ZH_20970 [Pseudomonas chlororaphis]